MPLIPTSHHANLRYGIIRKQPVLCVLVGRGGSTTVMSDVRGWKSGDFALAVHILLPVNGQDTMMRRRIPLVRFRSYSVIAANGIIYYFNAKSQGRREGLQGCERYNLVCSLMYSWKSSSARLSRLLLLEIGLLHHDHASFSGGVSLR